MNGAEAESGSSNSVDGSLVVGLLFLPIVFVWALLGRKYSSTIRIGAGIYAALLVIIGTVQISKVLG